MSTELIFVTIAAAISAGTMLDGFGGRAVLSEPSLGVLLWILVILALGHDSSRFLAGGTREIG